MANSLPSHRQLLSSLITAVCQQPPPFSSPLPENPSLKASIPPSRRQFLLTLHVLFPSLLLPALDLLDRELVARLIIVEQQQGLELPRGDRLYIVKSLASTLKGAQRRGTVKQVSERKYMVRLTAWNCTCASFALDAYGENPRSAATIVQTDTKEPPSGSLFGGLGLKGTDVPCCKHLLACTLAENWYSVLGGRVKSRNVTREELAGIIASI